MPIKTVRVTSFSELHRALSRFGGNDLWAYRGQGNPEWLLVPKAGRDPFNRVDDSLYLLEWKEGAAEFLGKAPRNDWEWLVTAQHYGLATRLLDWTRNPLVAAFFAIWEQPAADAMLFAHFVGDVFTFDPDPSAKLFDFLPENESVHRYVADAFVPRIGRQAGVFTLHNPPWNPLENNLSTEDQLIKILIAREYRDTLQLELARYGINRATLFPDLDGLASHVNWKFTGPGGKWWQNEVHQKWLETWKVNRKPSLNT